ncbi:hypothetical protein C8Q74DRAFT_1253711 [Fomes fomentarius]|nr:hypothetical protein C8Q74DRAFT_1253711 [Fomes fomentarius]
MSASTQLPAYPFLSVIASQLDISQALPGYTPTASTEWDVPAAEQQHAFSLVNKKSGTRWLSLTVTSRAASNTDPPTFFQGGDVSGACRLDLDTEEVVDDITITLYGRLDILSHSSSNFLQIRRTLFSAAEQEPQSSRGHGKRGRLNHQHEWTYSFRFPKGVSVMPPIAMDERLERQNYRLPPSFFDAQIGIDVQYLLVVRVNRAGLRAGSKLVVPIRYIPLARPCAPTILRQLAYRQNAPVVGPEDDPDGWKTLESITVEGTLFKTFKTSASYRLSISRPLTYTRGTSIHLHVSVDSANEQLLDLLTPQSMHLVLRQRIAFGETAQTARFSRRLSEKTTLRIHERATASWWHNPGYQQSGTMKTFTGELLIPEELAPATQILHYAHEYEIALYPPSAVGFRPQTSPNQVLLSESIAIVTAFAQGPHPRSYVPPEYKE